MKDLIAGLLLLMVCGCACYNPQYETYCTYAQVRKIADSDTYPAFKVVWAPLMFVPDTCLIPVTAYVDAANHPPVSKDKHVYLSYVGFRTMRNAYYGPKVNRGFMCVAQVFTAILDTAWFPVAGIIDTTWIVSRSNCDDIFSPKK